MLVTIRVRPSQQGGKDEYVRLAEMATMNEILAELAATARHYAKVRNHHHRATAWSSCGKVLATVGASPAHSSDFDHLFRRFQSPISEDLDHLGEVEVRSGAGGEVQELAHGHSRPVVDVPGRAVELAAAPTAPGIAPARAQL